MADDPNVVVPPAAPQPSGELEIQLETGEVFRGTPDQIIESMKHAQEESHRTISRERENFNSLKTIVEQRGLRDSEAPTDAQLKRMTPEERGQWLGRLALEPSLQWE